MQPITSDEVTALRELVSTLECSRAGFGTVADSLEDVGRSDLAALMHQFAEERVRMSEEIRRFGTDRATTDGFARDAGDARIEDSVSPHLPETVTETDLEFAGNAVDYLQRQGLSRDEIARCLIEHCGLDYATAYQMAAHTDAGET